MNHRANATTIALFGLLIVLLCGFNIYQTRNLQDQITALQSELSAARQEVTALKTEVQTLSAQASNPLAGLGGQGGGGLGDLSQLITPEMLQQALPLAQKMLEQMGGGKSGGSGSAPPADEVPAPSAE